MRQGFRRVGFAVALAAVAAGAVAVGARWASAESSDRSVPPRYLDHHRCGVADSSQLPPRTVLLHDFDGDGEDEHYVATWGGIERLRQQEGTVPPTMIRDALIYTSRANHQYGCVDLRALDADRDGDLELVYGSHHELVVLQNSRGRFRVMLRVPQELPVQADIRIIRQGGRLTVVAQ